MLQEFRRFEKTDQRKIVRITIITIVLSGIVFALSCIPGIQNYLHAEMMLKLYASIEGLIIGLGMWKIKAVLNPYRTRSAWLDRSYWKYATVCYAIIGMSVIVWFLPIEVG